MILTSRAGLRHCILRFGLVFALLVFTGTTDRVILSRAQSEQSSIPLLTKSTTITKQISKESPHRVEIEMRANEYVTIVLRKGDLKLAAQVFGPEEKPLGEFVSVRYEPLYVCFLSKQQGKHRLEIRSLEQTNSSTPYDLEVETHGLPTGDDLKVMEARKLMMEAGRLRAEWRESAIKEASLKYSSALKVWQEVGRPEETAKTFEELGDTHFLLSEYRTAQENYLQASRTFRASDRKSRIQALNKASYVDIYLGQSRRALESSTGVLRYYARSRSRGTDAHEQRHEAEAENTAGEASYSLGRLRQSIEFFTRALGLWKHSNDRGGQALANSNLGYTYLDRGDLSKARECFATALGLWRETGDQRGEALTLTAQGTIHSFLGEKQTALDEHLQAMKLLHAIGDRAGEAVTRNSIGYLYEELNEPHTALDNYEHALQIYQQIGNRHFEAVTRYYLGGVKMTLGNKQEALNYFKESLVLSRLVGQSRVTAYALSAIGASRSTEGYNDEALRSLNQALAVYRNVGDRRGQAIALNEIGRIYHSLGQTKRALAYYRRALPFTRAAGDLSNESTTLYQMALATRDSGPLDDALQYIKDAIKASESLRAQIVSPELRASYFASVNKYSELHINLLMKPDKLQPEKRLAQSAFEASERARARALLEIISEASAKIRGDADPDLLERERSLQEQLSAKAAYQMRVGTADKKEIETTEKEIRELTASYQQIQTEIKQKSPRYASLVQPQPLKLAEIQDQLRDPDTLLLEYSLGDEVSYLWAVSSDSFHAFELPKGDLIEATARDVSKLLTARQRLAETGAADYEEQAASSDQEYWRQAAILSDMVLKPVSQLLGRKRLLVVADGALQQVPFDALPDPAAGFHQDEGINQEPIPLFLNHEVVTLASGSILAVIRTGKPTNAESKLVAVLADPVFEKDDPRVRLPGQTVVDASSSVPDQSKYNAVRDIVAPGETGLRRLLATRQEAKAIMEVTPQGQGLTAMDFDASTSLISSGELERFKIIHFATHGVVNTEHPELSGVVLSLVNDKGESENGFLQLHDIYNLDLAQAQLVVLSACRTGLGKEVRGEGVMGLTRGFMYAGSESVIASLWKVDDRATAELMKHFYQAMFEDHLTPAAALRKAKEAMWQQPRWHAPYFWAAFVLQGEYRDPIVVPNTNRFRNHALIAMIVLSVIVVTMLKSKWLRKR